MKVQLRGAVLVVQAPGRSPHRLRQVGDGIIGFRLVQQRHAEIVLGIGIAGIELDRSGEVFHAFLVTALDVIQQKAQLLMRLDVVGIQIQRIAILCDGIVRLLLPVERVARADEGVIVEELLVDFGYRIGAYVDELGDVGGPVGRGQMGQPDRRCGAAVLVDVGQTELRVVRAGLGAEDQPLDSCGRCCNGAAGRYRPRPE